MATRDQLWAKVLPLLDTLSDGESDRLAGISEAFASVESCVGSPARRRRLRKVDLEETLQVLTNNQSPDAVRASESERSETMDEVTERLPCGSCEECEAGIRCRELPPFVEVEGVCSSSTVSLEDYPGAVDAVISVDEEVGEVTLVRRGCERPFVLDRWGDLQNWASHSLQEILEDEETQDAVVEAVRVAARKAGL